MTKSELIAMMVDRVIAKNNARKNPIPFSRMDFENIAVDLSCRWLCGASDRKINSRIAEIFRMANNLTV